MLISIKELEKYIVSPVTHQQLRKNEDSSKYCTTTNSEYYQIWNGFPVLIREGKGVIDPTAVLSNTTVNKVTRRKYNSVAKLLKRVTKGSSKVSSANVQTIKNLLANEEASKVLIIGGAEIGNSMDFFYENKGIQLVAFDVYPSSKIQFIADAHEIPLKSDTFDCVIIQAVLEHVLTPTIVVDEIARVLKPNGLVYSETPFMQQVHEGAYDFTRYTESGHRYLFKNFSCLKSGSIDGPGTALLWSIDYFTRSIFRSRVVGKIAKACFFWLRWFDLLISEEYAVDAASGFYFLGQSEEHGILPGEVIQHYKGAQ